MAGDQLPDVYLDTNYQLHYNPGTTHTYDAPDDVLEMAHKHWTTFPPSHPFIQHGFGIVFFVLWVLSTTGNGLVCFIFLKHRPLRTPSNMLVVSLALSDLLMINTVAPPLFINVFMSRLWAFGKLACELYGFLGGVFGTSSLILIIMIGYDRYNVIVRGMNGRRTTPCLAFTMIMFAYLYSFAISLAPMLKVWGSFKLEGLLLTCSFDYLSEDWTNKSFTLFYFSACYGVPLLIIIYFYSGIVKAVVTHERSLRAQAKKMNVDSLRSNTDATAESAEVRIGKVAITTVCLWILAWTPYAVVAMVGQFMGAVYLTPVITQLPSFLAKTASCLNPMVYAISHPKLANLAKSNGLNTRLDWGAKQTDLAPDEVLAITHPHWTQYPPVHPFIQHIFGILFFVLWIISVSGNGLVCFIFLKTKSLRTPSNMLVVALALSDLVMICTQAPPLFVNVFISKFWAFGPLACDLYGFLGGVFGCASLWMIIMIGFDRYNVIVKGFSGVRVTPGIAFLMIVFAFSYSVGLCILPFLKIWGSYKLEGLLLTCSFDYLTDDWTNKSFTLFFFMGCFGVPMLFIIYFYSQIVFAVVNHERALKAQAKKMNVESLRSNVDVNAESAEVRIAKVAITNICLWLLAWCPYATIAMVGQFGGSHLLTPVVTQLPSFLAKTASCFNPIVYAVSHPKYREALTNEIPCLGIKEESKVEETKTTAAETTAA
eukprot:maker-scaffold1125_size61249-snap-gene-0.12 protein:Tk00350 transcript:maker-scaffold1125_size61249-snap-gene-0.12-mRNA-1 annotation:"opsin"